MKLFLTTLLFACAAVLNAASAQVPEDSIAESAQSAGITGQLDLSSSIDFGPYTIAVPPGMIASAPANNQYHASLPSHRYSMVAMTSQGKPKHMRQIAGEAARSLGLNPAQLKNFEVDGMKGFSTTQKLKSKIITYALLRDGTEMLTIVISEPESLQPLSPKALESLKKR